MSLSLNEFLPEFKKHLGIYVIQCTYYGACEFLMGYEAGSGQFVLREFHSWLLLRRRGRPELYWTHLVLCEIYKDGQLPNIRDLDDEENGKAIDVLLSLLDEFFAARTSAQ